MSKFGYLMLLTPLIVLTVSCSKKEVAPGGSGLIETTEVIVSAEAAGQIERLYCDEGDHVAIGDTIAMIDTTTITLRLQQSAAMRQAAETKRQGAGLQVEKAGLDYDLAKKEFDRINSLIAGGSANQQQYDRAENGYSQARLARKTAEVALQSALSELQRIDAEIALLRKQLSDCHPLSPATGTVVTRYVESGELVAIGKPVVKVARLDTVWVKVYLPPSDLTRIKLGGRAEIDPEDGRSRPLAGSISWISSEAEFTPKNVQTKEARADLVYAVKITIPNLDQTLKIGMPVSVTMP